MPDESDRDRYVIKSSSHQGNYARKLIEVLKVRKSVAVCQLEY